MPDPNETPEMSDATAAMIAEAQGDVAGDAPATVGDVLSPDESLSEDVHKAQPCQDEGAGYAHGEDPDPDVSEARDLTQVYQDDPYGALRDFLMEFDPALKGCDFNPAEVAMARLGTSKTYLYQFMEQAGELRGHVERLTQERGALQAELVKASRKDVRDERIGAIIEILKAKVSEKAKVARIHQLLS